MKRVDRLIDGRTKVIVHASDPAIFDCPMCGKAVGVRMTGGVYRVRRHYHALALRYCWFSSAIPNDIHGGRCRLNR